MEINTISVQKKEMQVNMYNRQKTLMRGEELKWRHRSKEKQKEMEIQSTFM
jgi:hypothetical protein